MNRRLLVKNQGQTVSELTEEIPKNGIITVGSDSSSTIELEDKEVAPEQFVLVCDNDVITIISRSDGTFLNKNNFPKGSQDILKDGDEISVGKYTITADFSAPREMPQVAYSKAATSVEHSVKTTKTITKPQEKKQSVVSQKNENFGSEKSLEDILKNLRSDEKFYFLVEDDSVEGKRIYLEKEEMWIGWTEDEQCFISHDKEDLETICAHIRRDWSGVVIYPDISKSILVNDVILSEPKRLKNDDILILLAKNENGFDRETVIKFHEPTALLVLDSILPRELPPPVIVDKTAAKDQVNPINELNGNVEKQELDNSISGKKLKKQQTRIFGYFTFGEILIMIIGTLITASIIFLLLEYF